MTGLWYVGLLSTDGPTGTLHVFDRSHVAGLVSADIDRVQGPAEAFTLASTLSARPPIDLMRQRLECLATSHVVLGFMWPLLVKLHHLQMSCWLVMSSSLVTISRFTQANSRHFPPTKGPGGNQ